MPIASKKHQAKWGGAVTVNRIIVSDKKGMSKLYISDNPSDHRIFNPKGEKRSFEVIAEDKLDNFAKKDEMINLIKIDVQGAEGKCLRGMKRIISKNKNIVLFVEYWPEGLKEAGENPAEILKDLSKMGFKIYSLDEYNDFVTLISNYDKFNKEVLNKKRSESNFMNLLCTKKNINIKYV